MSESRKIQDGWGCALKRWWKRCFRGGLATPGWHWMRGKAAVPFPTPPSPLNVLCKMHITQRCALVYINIRQMKNAFSTKIGRVWEPKQEAGEEEHCSWRWALPWFPTKASHSQQRVLSTVPFSSPGMIWLLVLEDSQSVCCAMLQGKLLLLVLIKYMFSESEWCWWCGAKAHSQLRNHKRKVKI